MTKPAKPGASLDALAAQQGGHLTRRQMSDAGLARSTVRRRVAQGRVIPVGARTFRLASVAPSARRDIWAAILDTDGVASHWTAAWLHGLAARPPVLDLSVVKGRPIRHTVTRFPQQPDIRVHTSTNLPEVDVVTIDGMRATNVARTLMGMAALVPGELEPKGLANLVGKAVDADLATDPWLWALLTDRRCRGRNGVIALEDALAERARLGPTESWLEREVLRIIEGAGIALPATQRVVRRRGRFAARVDFLFEPHFVVVEAMGHATHRTREQLLADTARANELQLAGFWVLQFPFEVVVHQPQVLVSTVREALDARQSRAA